MLFLRALVQIEMQTDLSKIWTQVTISYNTNHYAKLVWFLSFDGISTF